MSLLLLSYLKCNVDDIYPSVISDITYRISEELKFNSTQGIKYAIDHNYILMNISDLYIKLRIIESHLERNPINMTSNEFRNLMIRLVV